MKSLANIEEKFLAITINIKNWMTAHPKIGIFLTGFFFGFVIGILF